MISFVIFLCVITTVRSFLASSLCCRKIVLLSSSLHSNTPSDLDAILERSANEFFVHLDSLKEDELIKKWRSSPLINANSISATDLSRLTRNKFSLEYMSVLKNSEMRRESSRRQSVSNILVLSISGIFSSFIIPILPMDSFLKNTFGILLIAFPFLYLVAGIFLSLDDVTPRTQDKNIDVERICCHEAGHFIIGYLLGLPVTHYNVKGDRNSGSLFIDIPPGSQEMEGSLLVMSMAGVVAESLKFGNTKGGVEDFSFALEVLDGIPSLSPSEFEGYLRWAAAEALSLLTEHRDDLDAVTAAMIEQKSVGYCMEVIEGLTLRNREK